MKAMGIVGSALIMMTAWSVFAVPAEFAGGNPSFAITETKTTKEKVEDVDYATRRVKLKDESGHVRVIKAGTDIHNLGSLKIGDEVTIETFLTVSAEVKPGEGAPMNVGVEGQTAPLPGEKPSGIRTIEGELRTKIEAINYDKRTVTFKGRKGDLVTYTIGPDAKRFNEIRKGDMLWVEYSQTIKLTVK